jgi:hypothetical protein
MENGFTYIYTYRPTSNPCYQSISHRVRANLIRTLLAELWSSKNSFDFGSSSSLTSLEEPEPFCNSFDKSPPVFFFRMVYEENVGGAGRSHVFGALSLNKKTTLALGLSTRSHFYDCLAGLHDEPELNPSKEPC